MKTEDKEFADFIDSLPQSSKDFLRKNNITNMQDFYKFILAYNGNMHESSIEKKGNIIETNFAEVINNKSDNNALEEQHDEELVNLFVEDSTYKQPVELHLRIKLNHSPIDIWREIKVPSNISLEFLAIIINEVVGWFGYHLHQFSDKEKLYKNKVLIEQQNEWFAKGFETWTTTINAEETSVASIFKEKGKRIKYEYDFGDGWEHDVWMKGIREYNAYEPHRLIVVKGKGMDPLEDCGGIWGLSDIIDIYNKKRKTKEEKETLEYYGLDQKNLDLEYFDIEFAQEKLDSLWSAAQQAIESDKKTL